MRPPSINQILENLGEDDDTVGHGRIESGDEEESNQASLKVSKKRKGRLLSDSEESDADEDESKDREVEETETPVEDDKEYDSEENEIVQPKKVVKQNLFDKKGKLRRDFYDDEAELSDEEEGRGELSDDEDEKGLDRFEMEL